MIARAVYILAAPVLLGATFVVVTTTGWHPGIPVLAVVLCTCIAVADGIRRRIGNRRRPTQ